MKTNITILGIVNDFNKKLSQKLAEQLEMYYVDAEELIAYYLFDEKNVLENCGMDYLLKQQNKTIKEIGGYENTVISLKSNFFMDNKNREAIKASSYVVYLKINRELFKKYVNKTKDESKKTSLTTDLIVFDERDKIATKYADIVINLESLAEATAYKKIYKEIEKLG